MFFPAVSALTPSPPAIITLPARPPMTSPLDQKKINPHATYEKIKDQIVAKHSKS